MWKTNSGSKAPSWWRAVEILRAVDDILRDEQNQLDGRDRSVAVHGNRLIAHAVFQALPDKALDEHGADFDAVKAMAPHLTRRALTEMREIVEQHYPTNYLAALFKNASRRRDVVEKLPDLASGPAGRP